MENVLTYYDMIKIVSENLNNEIKDMIEDMEDLSDFRPILFMIKTGKYISFSLTMKEPIDLLVKYAICYSTKFDSDKYKSGIDYPKVILNKTQVVNIKGEKFLIEDVLNMRCNDLYIMPIMEGSFITTKSFLKNN